jgi:hypothetical protein
MNESQRIPGDKRTEQMVLAIPFWQIDEVRDRIIDYQNNPDQALDFDNAMDEIEAEL